MLKDCEDKVHKIKDYEWSEILDKYGIDFHYDTVRKGQQPPLFGGVFIKEYFEQKFANKGNGYNEEDFMKALRLEKQEIRKEKQKLFDERRDLNKRLREEARLENSVDLIDSALERIADTRYLSYSPIVNHSERDMIVCLSDLHIGQEFYNFTGNFNSDIAKERLNEYLCKCIEYAELHQVENAYVTILGDGLSNNIHKNLSVTNKENVIEQVKILCELVSDFVYELGQHVSFVEVHNVGGNHTRLEKKEDALAEERLDALLPWFMKNMLKHLDNIKVVEEEVDSTFCSFFVRGKYYLGVHGDYDAMTDSAISKLVLWSGLVPYCILSGHKHFHAMGNVQGIKTIQSGSLAGTGDQFTREKRLKGRASQTLVITNNGEIECVYPVEFKS